MLLATRAALAGDFTKADQLCAEALRIAEEGEIRAGRIAWVLFRASVAHLRGDPSRIAIDQQYFDAVATTSRSSEWQSFAAWVYAATGRPEEARAMLDDIEGWLHSYPFCLLCGEAISILGDAELAKRVYPTLLAQAADHTFFWGPFGSAIFGPTQRIAAQLAHLMGKTEEARSPLRRGDRDRRADRRSSVD